MTNKNNKLEKDIAYVLGVVKEQNDKLDYFKLVKEVQQKISSDRKYAQDAVNEAESRGLIVKKELSDFISTYSLPDKSARFSY